jgi:hypothetical protein
MEKERKEIKKINLDNYKKARDKITEGFSKIKNLKKDSIVSIETFEKTDDKHINVTYEENIILNKLKDIEPDLQINSYLYLLENLKKAVGPIFFSDRIKSFMNFNTQLLEKKELSYEEKQQLITDFKNHKKKIFDVVKYFYDNSNTLEQVILNLGNIDVDLVGYVEKMNNIDKLPKEKVLNLIYSLINLQGNALYSKMPKQGTSDFLNQIIGSVNNKLENVNKLLSFVKEKDEKKGVEKGNDREVDKGDEKDIGKGVEKGKEKDIEKGVEKGKEKDIEKGVEKGKEIEKSKEKEEKKDTQIKDEILEKIVEFLKNHKLIFKDVFKNNNYNENDKKRMINRSLDELINVLDDNNEYIKKKIKSVPDFESLIKSLKTITDVNKLVIDDFIQNIEKIIKIIEDHEVIKPPKKEKKIDTELSELIKNYITNEKEIIGTLDNNEENKEKVIESIKEQQEFVKDTFGEISQNLNNIIDSAKNTSIVNIISSYNKVVENLLDKL